MGLPQLKKWGLWATGGKPSKAVINYLGRVIAHEARQESEASLAIIKTF